MVRNNSLFIFSFKTMRSFLKKILYFGLLPVLLLLIALSSLDILSKKMIDLSNKQNEIYYLIAGDSHIRQTFDDKKIKFSKNIAQNSESYYFTYYKLKEILKPDSKIKIVYLGLSHHNLSGYIDDFIFGKFSGSVAKNYFFIMPMEEKFNLMSANNESPLNFLKGILITGLKNLFKDEKSFIGGYNNIFFDSRAEMKSIKKRINLQYYKNNKEVYKPSEINLVYLNKIIDLCTKKRVELVFLNPPLNKSYKVRIPPFYIDYYNYLVQDKNIKIIHFDHLVLDEKCFIPDGDHVSHKGAEICTSYLKSILETKL